MARQIKKGGSDNLLICTLLATEPVRTGARVGYSGLAFHAESRQLVAVTADHNFVFIFNFSIQDLIETFSINSDYCHFQVLRLIGQDKSGLS